MGALEGRIPRQSRSLDGAFYKERTKSTGSFPRSPVRSGMVEPRLVTLPNFQWYSNCWSPELGLFCAVALNGTVTQQIITSRNGINWTARTSPAAIQWLDVCWSSKLRLFAAVAATGIAAQQIMTSPNGITWQSRTAPNTVQHASICASDEFGFVAVTLNATAAQSVVRSVDGITWTNGTAVIDTGTWRGVCYSPKLRKFCAVSDTTATRSMTSIDGGLTWIGGNLDTSKAWKSVCWADSLGMFVAVGTSAIATSIDGTTWVNQFTSNAQPFYDVCWMPERNTLFAIIDGGGTTKAATSSDGVNWRLITTPSPNQTWRHSAWSPKLGRLVSVSQGTSGLVSI
jgi:hypothetical protein